MSETPKHASGKTDFELVEAAIDVAVNGADLHEDDEECPQDDTCECRDAATVNDGHRALVRMDRDISSLREQVRALTAERDAFTASLEREAQVADALRARVAEVDAAHLLLDRAGQSPVQPHLGLRIQALLEKCDEGWRRAKALESERDAAQQRAKALEVCLARELTKEEAP